MSRVELTVPDLGNFSDVDIVDVLVKPGEVVAVDTPLVTLETDKASMDVPSTAAGTVTEVLVKRGDKVSKGSVLARLDTAASAAQPSAPASPAAAIAAAANAPAARIEVAGDTVRMPSQKGGPADRAGSDYNSSTQLLVFGAGPGGYTAAFRAADLGMKVTLVERWPDLGGVCLNVGCIPSKALLTASESYEEVAHRFVQMGIKSNGRELDLNAMMAFKDQGVDGNVKGVAFLFRKNKIDTIHGHGRIMAPGQVEVKANGTSQRLDTKAIVIATGSDVARLNGIAIDQQRIVDSTGALKLAAVPPRLLVIGAGVIGLELGSVWRRLGAEVIVVEFLDRVLAGMDGELGRQAQRIFQRQGMTFQLAHKVTAIDTAGPRLAAKIEPTGGGASESIEVDVALVAIGRVPYTEGLGLDEVGVQRDNRGRVMVDAQLATNVAGIYAIGDVIAGPMLAHKAQDEGVAVAERLAGKAGHVNYDVIPNVVYTYPEIASVGKSEEELKEAGIEYRTGKFPFTANGRAKASLTTEGFVKILADARNDRVLGVHIMGADAGNMIAEAAVAMEFGAAAEDIARTCHAHPTLTEAVKEAALAVDGRAIHL